MSVREADERCCHLRRFLLRSLIFCFKWNSRPHTTPRRACHRNCDNLETHRTQVSNKHTLEQREDRSQESSRMAQIRMTLSWTLFSTHFYFLFVISLTKNKRERRENCTNYELQSFQLKRNVCFHFLFVASHIHRFFCFWQTSFFLSSRFGGTWKFVIQFTERPIQCYLQMDWIVNRIEFLWGGGGFDFALFYCTISEPMPDWHLLKC